MDENSILEHLEPDEKLLWSGSPEKRIFTKHELLRIPVSTVLIIAFAAYWIFRQDVSNLMLAVVAAALSVVFYNTFGKLALKAIHRKRTFYLLTENRVIIILANKTGECKKTAQTYINDLVSSAIALNRDGTGSILFSEYKTTDTLPLKIGDNWPALFGHPMTAFFDIKKPEDVYLLYKNAKKILLAVSGETGTRPLSIYDE